MLIISNSGNRSATLALESKVGSAPRTNTKPVVFRETHVGRHPLARTYGVFVENQNRRGACWWVGDMYWKGKLNLLYNAEAMIGVFFGYGNGAVVRRAAGSGGVGGTVGGGWAFGSSTVNEQCFGGFNAISTVAGDNAVFTFTGDAVGLVGAYFRSDIGGYAMVAIDNDWTKANGPLVGTVTQADLDCGRFASTFTLNNGNTQPSLGAKYVDFRRATLFSEHVGLWENESEHGAHTCEILVINRNGNKDTTGSRVGFSGFWASSTTLGNAATYVTTNGATFLPVNTTASGLLVFPWREINATRTSPLSQTFPVIGGGAHVFDRVYEMANSAGGTYYFNRQSHSDASVEGPLEMGHVPGYMSAVAGTNNAGQAVLNVRTGDGLGFAANDYIMLETRSFFTARVNSISGDALTLDTNLTVAANLNTAAERLYRCNAAVSGAVTTASSVVLNTSSHSILPGDAIVFGSGATLPVACHCESVNGATLTLDRAVTLANNIPVWILCRKGYENSLYVDNNRPLYLRPGAWWIPTDTVFMRRVYTSSYATDSTTTTVSAAAGSNTVTVASDSLFSPGTIVKIFGRAPQVRRLVSKSSNVLTLDAPLDAYVHSGARVDPGMFIAEDVCSWNTNDAWQFQCSWVEKDYRLDTHFKAMYDVMHTNGYSAPRAWGPLTITGATNANPIVITCANHGLTTGEGVRIVNVGGNTAANGNWPVTVINTSTFSIPVSGNGAYTSGGSFLKGAAITGATNASPIVITSNNHGLTTDDRVSISGVAGNTAANGDWQITRLTSNTFSLNGSTGNGTYSSGGVATLVNINFITWFNSLVNYSVSGTTYSLINYDHPKAYNGGATIFDAFDGGVMTAYYDTRHPLVYALKIGNTEVMQGSVLGTSRIQTQRRATGDTKVYYQVGASDGSTALRRMPVSAIRRGSFYQQIRRIPGFASLATRI